MVNGWQSSQSLSQAMRGAHLAKPLAIEAQLHTTLVAIPQWHAILHTQADRTADHTVSSGQQSLLSGAHEVFGRVNGVAKLYMHNTICLPTAAQHLY